MSLFRRGSSGPSAATPPTGAAGEPPADETASPGMTGAVPGERGIPPATHFRSVQSRVTSVLSVALLCALAAGLLIWYYSGAINRSARAQELAAAAAKRRAQSDGGLPPLGVIVPPKPAGTDDESTLKGLIGPPPSAPPEIPPNQPIAIAPAGPPKKSAAELELERRLGGPVLSNSANERASAASGAQPGEYVAASSEGPGAAQLVPTSSESPQEGSAGSADTLGSLLKPTATPAIRARVLPTQRYLLPKGAFIDCTLETAISSALPGMTTCITATDTFSADGQVVLLERGSKLVGETRGQVQQGSPRLFVLWTEARTPKGVSVPLTSPGTDELGRSGLSGVIDRHWWLRFGTAILITVIDGAVQGFTERSGNGNSTIVLNPSTSNEVATEILRDTVRIPPTIEKAQGDRIQILVARDVDFRSVYNLDATGPEE